MATCQAPLALNTPTPATGTAHATVSACGTCWRELCIPECLSLALNTIGSLYLSFCVDMLPPLNALVVVLLALLGGLLLGALAGLACAAAVGVALLDTFEGDGDGLGDTFCRCRPAVLLATGAEASTDLTDRPRCSTPGMTTKAAAANTTRFLQPYD